MKTSVLTVGQIADRLGQPPSRVAYLIGKYRLKPIARVGIIRLFGEAQVECIREGVDQLQRRTAKHGGFTP